MGLADILVHIDHYAGSTPRLDLAVSLAQRHQARLTGLMVVKHPQPTQEAVAEAQDRFEQCVAQAGIEGEWRCMDGAGALGGMTGIICSQAPCSDLIVVGQGSRDSSDMGGPFELPESLVLASGLPVLVVPYAGSFTAVGQRVLVAWKAGRESTRALNDAAPILKGADFVEILTVDDSGSRGENDPRLSAQICDHLARHGVKTKASRLVAGNLPLGDVFLNRICDGSFDLLVMGAYAHGPNGKLELGQAARQLLKEMTVPVLMSH